MFSSYKLACVVMLGLYNLFVCVAGGKCVLAAAMDGRLGEMGSTECAPQQRSPVDTLKHLYCRPMRVMYPLYVHVGHVR